MILLRPSLAESLDSVQAVQGALQQAIMLEHATIPTYLYALYSLAPGANEDIRGLIASVVKEEMSHMALAANVLNAIGGAPVIDDPAFVPSYPGPLPGSIEPGLIVPLKPFSRELVKDVFMAIEQPETPLEFPTEATLAGKPLTIGIFYAAIFAALKCLGDGVFIGDPGKQVTHAFTSSDLIAVGDLETARQAVRIVVEQGEGTPISPLDPERKLAHYYRFAEIYCGRALIRNPDVPDDAPPDKRYVYGGDPIVCDPQGILPAVANPKATDYPPESSARYACDSFNYTYTALLKTLHKAFNGEPESLGGAIGLMESIKVQGTDMMSGPPIAAAGETPGPTFEYQSLNPAVRP
jgi:hypothetical protein